MMIFYYIKTTILLAFFINTFKLSFEAFINFGQAQGDKKISDNYLKLSSQRDQIQQLWSSIIFYFQYLQHKFFIDIQQLKNQMQGKWSKIFGATGAIQGGFQVSGFRFVGVIGTYGELLNSIKFFFEKDGKKSNSDQYGGKGGNPFSWNAPQGQWITKIEVWSENIIFAIRFTTNSGVSSPKYGGNEGDYNVVQFNQFRGVQVKCGSVIQGLKFKLA